MKKYLNSPQDNGGTVFRCEISLAGAALVPGVRKFVASGESLERLDRCARAFNLTRRGFLCALALGELPNQPEQGQDIGPVAVKLSPTTAAMLESVRPFIADTETIKEALEQHIRDFVYCFYDDLVFHPETGKALAERDEWDDGDDVPPRSFHHFEHKPN